LIRQTYEVKKFWQAAWATIWANRTGLEQTLLLVSAGLIGLVVALVIALVRDSAPLETEWGNVAGWAGVSVTFLGFVGAIAALRVQVKSVEVQVKQHNKTEMAEQDAKRQELAAQEAEALQKKQQDAKAVTLTVAAGRRDAGRGHQFVEKQPFVVTCLLAFPRRNAKYTNVEFKHPDKPEDFRVEMDDSADTDITTVNWGARIHWQVSGDEWPYGPEADAKAWVGSRTSVTFTDPSGIQWQLDGTGSLAEVNK
jgi:hypothetical protein